jgi:predicted chitinase
MSKRGRYVAAAIIDFCLILAILIYGRQSMGQLISPFASSLQSLYQQKVTPTTFSFAPGLAQNKFSKIDFDNLNTLAFFDVPIEPNEGIVEGSRGYNSFRSDEAAKLFETAHFNKTKVLLTLTLAGNDSISEFLNDSKSQEKVSEQLLTEIDETKIDGVVISLESRNLSKEYTDKFNKFIELLANSLHSQNKDLQVAVAIPSWASENSIFNPEKLAKVSDKILVIASDFAVPETKDNSPESPVFGYSSNDYWSQVSKTLSSFSKKVPEKKLVLERAWYGNGDRYPLYKPNQEAPIEGENEPSHVLLDSETIDRLVSSVPTKAITSARKNIPLIAKALEKEGILDSNVLAYALATIEHETADTFEPLEEYGGRLSARRLGYEGGTNYFGRGFIQLTHLRNYQAMGRRIGMGDELVKHPELAADPETSAKILAAFFKDNNIANLASRGNFIAARVPVNPDRNAYGVASLAWKYEDEIN